MKIKPLSDWVVIQSSGEKEKSAGGIIIPEVAKEKPQVGTVEAVGPGRYETEEDSESKEDRRFVPTEVKPGDKVLYERYMVSEFEIDGENVTMIREQYILGIIEG